MSAFPPDEARRLSLHGQDLDLQLLLDLYRRLDPSAVIDVGAEKGAFVEAFLREGCRDLHAFEPFPPHAEALRARFRDDGRVRVHEVAITVEDGQGLLNIAEDAAGVPYDYHHSLERFADTADIRWRQRQSVICRSLASLVARGEVPPRVGVLKIDTDGHDQEVLRGLGALEADVIMVEYWHDPPGGPAPARYTLGSLAEMLLPRGYAHVAVIKRHDECQVMQIDSITTRPGDWGNAVFLHQRVASSLRPVACELATATLDLLIDRTLHFRTECHERWRVIEDLRTACDERLRVIEDLRAVCDERLRLIQELHATLAERPRNQQ
jgi:FkbM family methyltransferase